MVSRTHHGTFAYVWWSSLLHRFFEKSCEKQTDKQRCKLHPRDATTVEGHFFGKVLPWQTHRLSRGDRDCKRGQLASNLVVTIYDACPMTPAVFACGWLSFWRRLIAKISCIVCGVSERPDSSVPVTSERAWYNDVGALLKAEITSAGGGGATLISLLWRQAPTSANTKEQFVNG